MTARVAILGLGGVGRALVRQIAGTGGGVSIVAVADSSAGLASSSGKAFSNHDLLDLVSHKEKGGKVADFAGAADTRRTGPDDLVLSLPDVNQNQTIVVADCSNSDSSVCALRLAVARGFRVASANKKPFADSSFAVFQELTRWHGSCRFESTVGAATPMVATAMRLRAANDDVRSITGSLSGTLGYIFSELEGQGKKGEQLSTILQRAIHLGYTEPDCRDDLSGVDVQRKAVILARVMGHAVSMSDVCVEAVYPAGLAKVPYAEFVERVCVGGELDAGMASRLSLARSKECVVRYVASMSAGTVRVGLKDVPASSPLGRLTGTGNLVQFESRYFDPLPLVLQGAGAGGENTASGVLADIVELAHLAPAP